MTPNDDIYTNKDCQQYVMWCQQQLLQWGASTPRNDQRVSDNLLPSLHLTNSTHRLLQSCLPYTTLCTERKTVSATEFIQQTSTALNRRIRFLKHNRNKQAFYRVRLTEQAHLNIS